MKNNFMVKALKLTALPTQFIAAFSLLSASSILRFLIPDSRLPSPSRFQIRNLHFLPARNDHLPPARDYPRLRHLGELRHGLDVCV
jgi:hypothetical protein